MSHSDPVLREAFEHSDYDTIPVRTIYAIQGGGSWSIAAAEALKVSLPYALRAGTVDAVAGTSGGAANAALVVKALNEGLGAEGAAHYLDLFWEGEIKRMGATFPIPRPIPNMFSDPADAWPNIPRSYLTLAQIFHNINPLAQLSLTTGKIRDTMNKIIGDWGPVQSGKTAIYTNSVRHNVFTGAEEYQVANGKQVDADAIASSAGLDELGGHIKLSEIMSPFNWATGNINRYRDGAYRMNPDLETMLNRQQATDIIVIVLHGGKGEVKSKRARKLYTDEIMRDLVSMQLDDGRTVNVHAIELSLPGNDTSRMNTEPRYLELLQKLGREQATAQMANIAQCLGVTSSYSPPAALVADMIEKKELAYV